MPYCAFLLFIKEKYMDKKQAWGVYEANVQAYRSIMLSSQSMLLAVCAILIDKTAFLFISIIIIAILQLWYIWFRVIRSRVMIVDYYKYEMYENTKGYSETDYVKDKEKRKELNEIYNIKKFRPTRFKLDILLPLTLTFIWISMLIYKLNYI